jgi:predicted nucleic acid-binding protein
MKVMIDTNCVDALLDDEETRNELINRRDLRLYVSPVQRLEVQAMPDSDKAGRALAIVEALCVEVGAPVVRADEAHGADSAIIESALAHCDLLVSLDEGLLEAAQNSGLRALPWPLFLRKFVWREGKGRR